jgi:hypothetical protein
MSKNYKKETGFGGACGISQGLTSYDIVNDSSIINDTTEKSFLNLED